ncbi:fatty acid alpha-hydroxylase [Sugiyamaella lignohabitans]|uniref:Ceramide very long chain fatty acid hydroxylase n=1 Tax=Sugiyamaella lignohabitans TaxID=796027 RepID=A0A167CDG4_9ASCO|nr:fatty acid alpha-hydroxylase [Sugiyamaella lignohabitans]ANB11550.1 fatty acid alpha-hydroxylase [Sugiyamaella lignohabitans]
MATAKSLPFITKAELEAQRKSSSHVLVTLNNRKVYDVTDFVEAHPGGADLIRDYPHHDITKIMADIESHAHSESAYEMMDDDYLVAILATEEEERELLTDSNRRSFVFSSSGGDDDAEAELTVTTDFSNDYNTHKFLDLNKPLLWQVLFGKFTKEFYLEQVHKPRHYGKGSAPIFGNFLEPLTKTPWFVIPIIWIPADIYCISLALEGLHPLLVVVFYTLGLCIWTLLEYILHRFLFHLDHYLPDNQVAFTLHFLLHGVHHYLPMDGLRLVMPPALLVILTTPLYKLAHIVFAEYYAKSVFAGAFMGYILYDVTHYSLHHAKLPSVMKTIKTNHLDHHYKNYELGFGVTSKFWDRVFGTEMVDTDKKL